MDTIQIVHCADIHFDSSFSIMQSRVALRREEQKESFRRVIKQIQQNNSDLLLLAGDLFESQLATKETIIFLKNCFEAIPQTYIFISPGNHDPASPGSFYLTETWPSNVHIFKGAPEMIELPKKNVRVYGAGFTSTFSRTPLLINPLIVDTSYINILLIHGDIAASNSSYNSITPDIIEASKMDYVALGHIHNFSGILKAGNTFYAYCGTPEGRGFDETGDKGIISGNISKSLCELKFVPTCIRKYITIEIDISNCSTIDDVVQRIVESCLDETNLYLYKVILKGSIDSNFRIKPSLLLTKLKSKYFYIKIIDYTVTKVNLEILRKETSLKGIFTSNMLTKIAFAENKSDTAGAQLLTEALNIGLRAFEGEVLPDED